MRPALPEIRLNLQRSLAPLINAGVDRASLAFHLRILADDIETPDWRSKVPLPENLLIGDAAQG